MSGVFINYRAKDNPLGAAGIHDMLARRFGYERVFRDSVSMKAGEHYPTELREGVERADVLVAVIGPYWNTLGAEDGGVPFVCRDRDWVRWEIGRAIERGIPVVPVLLTDLPEPTEPPDRDILPADIRELANFQHFTLSQRSLGADLDRLAARLVELVPDLVVPRLFGGPPPRRTADHVPSTLLRPEYAIVPFDGRAGLLGDLRSWASGPGSGVVRLVVGPTGCGKTRLAGELCTALAGDGWLAGIVPADAPAVELAQLGVGNRPVLAVIDDVETSTTRLAAIAATIADRPRTSAPVRLLLLGRTAGNWLTELRRHADQRVAGLFRAMTVGDTVTMDAGTTDRYGRFARAYTAFAQALGRTGVDGVLSPGVEDCASLLDIHAAALNSVLDATDAAGEPPLRTLLRHDRTHWQALAAAEGRADLDPAALDAIGTVATLCRPSGAAQAASVRDRLANFLGDVGYSVEECVAFADRLRPGRHSLCPVAPTALGEELVAATLARQPTIVTTLAANCTDEQIGNALAVLGNAYPRRREIETPILDLLRVDLERLVPIAVRVASAVEEPEEFSRLVSTALSGNRISADGIFGLMDQLSKGNTATNPVRAAVLRSLMDWAQQLMGGVRPPEPPDSPLAPLQQIGDRLTGFMMDAFTGFLDPNSGVFPKGPGGRDIVPPDLLATLRMLLERKWDEDDRND